MQNLFNKTS